MTAVMEALSREELRLLGRGDRMRLLQQFAQAERELAAGFADLLDVMDTEGDHVADGHRTVRHLLVAQTNTSHTDAAIKVKAMRTLRLLPEVRKRLAAGEFGVAQLQSLTVAYGNPRVRDYLAVIEDQLLDWAELPHDEFDDRVREFTRRADADGAEQRDNARHERRSLHLSQSGDGFHGTFGCGNTQGVVISKVLDHSPARRSMPIGPTPKPVSVTGSPSTISPDPPSSARWTPCRRSASPPPPPPPACRHRTR